MNDIIRTVASVIEGEHNAIANMANIASVLYHSLEGINWVGFYLVDGNELVLGPFHGKVACIRIGMGRGVCGTAAESRQTIIVPDVDAFPGHIACDSASRSEIVVPMIKDNRVVGVLDLDSPHLGRFTEEDAAIFEAVRDLVVEGSDWLMVNGR